MSLYTTLKYSFLAIVILTTFNLQAQPRREQVLRVTEMNDFLNITGHGTDRAFTNGTRFDFLYQGRAGKRPSLFDRLTPDAGANSINVHGWSLMQIMVTPTDIARTTYQSSDYAYAGGLFASHSKFSYNPEKKLMVQTELIFGIRGPASFAKETQIAIHSLIHYQKPMGWDNQLVTQPLVNLEVVAEKTVWSPNRFMDLSLGGRVAVGSLADMAYLQSTLRMGLLPKGMDGFFTPGNGNRGRLNHAYVFVRPRQAMILYNAMLEGRNLAEVHSSGKVSNDPNGNPDQHPAVNSLVSQVEFGFAFGTGNFSLGYTQNYSSAYSRVSYDHSVGSITVAMRL